MQCTYNYISPVLILLSIELMWPRGVFRIPSSSLLLSTVTLSCGSVIFNPFTPLIFALLSLNVLDFTFSLVFFTCDLASLLELLFNGFAAIPFGCCLFGVITFLCSFICFFSTVFTFPDGFLALRFSLCGASEIERLGVTALSFATPVFDNSLATTLSVSISPLMSSPFCLSGLKASSFAVRFSIRELSRMLEFLKVISARSNFSVFSPLNSGLCDNCIILPFVNDVSNEDLSMRSGVLRAVCVFSMSLIVFRSLSSSSLCSGTSSASGFSSSSLLMRLKSTILRRSKETSDPLTVLSPAKGLRHHCLISPTKSSLSFLAVTSKCSSRKNNEKYTAFGTFKRFDCA
eukprot:TRINITY_DN6062_c0_g1_i14.p1 TRINITY_DN6062_c0_g1~~TRINITY_DN6062_c0_g1_i14.p1  ORF type:complete len:346 (+),score=-36.36 TRINITY_DN6062_c0_g1_i14:93-1130(+)